MRSRIFVPFHDGLLDYDCRECGEGCCQSGNIVANEGEKRILLQEYPFIKFFFAGEENNRYTFHKHQQCWFLESNGFCEIQRKHGYSIKPFICRLHPFYIARCGDEYVVIPSGCEALRVTKRGKQSNISHESVLANAEEAIGCGFIRKGIDWSAERLDLERKVLKEAREFLDHVSYIDFAAFQTAAATGNKNLSGIRTQLNETVDLWKSLLGIQDLEMENETLTYELTAITSLLRVSDYGLRNMEGDRIPLALLALYLYMILYAKGGGGKRFASTYQSVLGDIPLGLAYFAEGDLRSKKQSLEKKLLYLRALRQIHAPGFLKTLKTKTEADKE